MPLPSACFGVIRGRQGASARKAGLPAPRPLPESVTELDPEPIYKTKGCSTPMASRATSGMCSTEPSRIPASPPLLRGGIIKTLSTSSAKPACRRAALHTWLQSSAPLEPKKPDPLVEFSCVEFSCGILTLLFNPYNRVESL